MVLVIALVSLSLLGYFPGTAGGAQESESSVYWRAVALPFRVLEVTQVRNNTFVMVLENAGVDSVTLTGINLSGTSELFSETRTRGGIYFGGGEKKRINVWGNARVYGEAGKFADTEIVFSYRTSHGTLLVQKSDKKLKILLKYTNVRPPSAPLPAGCKAHGGACTLSSECCDFTDSCYSGVCCNQNSACSANSDCCGGLLCNSGICGASPPACIDPESCRDDSDCCDGNCVDGICAAPVAVECLAQGEFCASNIECCSENCEKGKCAFPVLVDCFRDGEACNNDEECCSWSCVDGACAVG
jgi:hypothetical protein